MSSGQTFNRSLELIMSGFVDGLLSLEYQISIRKVFLMIEENYLIDVYD